MAENGMIQPFESGQVRYNPLLKSAADDELRGIVYSTQSTTEHREAAAVELQSREDGSSRRLSRNVISYGCSSFGYDMRVADEFKVFTNVYNTVVDPKNIDERAFVEIKGDHCIIPPNSFALAYSVEKFRIPSNVLAMVIGKSSYARCGIMTCCTPLEPGWYGHVTIEISNNTPLPAKVYANEGLCQVLFFESNENCKTSYADRNGKYQDQGPEVVLPKA